MRLTPVDKKAAVEGVEVPYRGATLIIARAGNTRFKRIFRSLLKPYKHQVEKNNLPAEVSDEIMNQAYAETILVGWKNFIDYDTKKEFPYSVQNAISFLEEDADAFEIVREASEDMERFLLEEEADTVKKS